MLGAAAGLFLARAFSQAILAFVTTEQYTPYLNLALDWRVLAFTGAVALSTCLIFGLTPAFRASRTDPGKVLKTGGRGLTAGRGRSRLQGSLVIGQLAVSLVLLIGAVLLVRSFWNLITLDPGFREKGIVLASLDLSKLQFSNQRNESVKRDLLERIESLPQIQAAASTTHVPLDGSSWTLGVRTSGMQDGSKFTWVSPAYFRTMGIPLLAGREFNDRDTATSQPVAIVNQTFVRKFFGSLDPLGKTFRTIAEPNYPSTHYEIVAVVKDGKYANLRDEIPPQCFAPEQQFPISGPFTNMLIRSSAPSAAVISEVREALKQVSPGIRSGFEVFQTSIQDDLLVERLIAVLSGFFGGLAALLAALGLYGVISCTVLARTNEIGIRLALGANRRDIMVAIMRQAFYLVLPGAVAGLLMVSLAARWASSLLFGIRPTDLVTFCGATIFLGIVAAAATFMPARRAARLDPMLALRYE